MRGHNLINANLELLNKNLSNKFVFTHVAGKNIYNSDALTYKCEQNVPLYLISGYGNNYGGGLALVNPAWSGLRISVLINGAMSISSSDMYVTISTSLDSSKKFPVHIYALTKTY